MPSELGKTVGDYVTLQRGITYSGKLVGEPGPALLGLGSIAPGGGFRIDNYKTFGGECPSKIMLIPGDIYVALKGATKDGSMVGSVAMLPASVSSGRLTQDTARLDFVERDPKVVSHLYWVLRTPQYRQYCAGRLTGSAAASFSREDFLSYPVPTMTSISRAIVSLLEAIETKIELNRRMNETLEAIARAIFKSWFVNFDPVRAKANGESAKSICRRLGLTPDFLALFPDCFQDSELGKIPKGWGVGTIADHCNLNVESWSGKTIPNEVHYVDLANAKNGIISEVQVFSSEAAPSRARRVLRSGDTIIGTVRPGNRSFALIGSETPQLTGSTGFAVLSPKWPQLRELVYCLATSDENIDRLSRLADGAAYPAVRPEVVTSGRAVVPAPEVVEAFHNLVVSMFDFQMANWISNNTLGALRDTLLPKLLSGELRLPVTGEE